MLPDVSDIDSLLTRVSKAPGFREVVDLLCVGQDQAVLDHVDDAGVSLAVALGVHSHRKDSRVWVVAPHLRAQEHIAAELRVWGMKKILFLPDDETGEQEGMGDPELIAERLSVLQKISSVSEKKQIIILTRNSLDCLVPSFEDQKEGDIKIHVGMQISPELLIGQFAGFEGVPKVIARGQWSKRGGIIDVFPLQSRNPYRIEFFGDEIESLREFDIDTQISFKKIQDIVLVIKPPASKVSLRDWIKPSDLVITTPHSAVAGNLSILNAPVEEGTEDFSTAIYGNPLGNFEAGDLVMQEMKRAMAERQLEEWGKKEWQTVIFFPNKGEEERFREICAGNTRLVSSLFLKGDLSQGFTVPAAKLAVISSSELFGRYQTVSSRRRSAREEKARKSRAQASLREINPGDLVVHTSHGIGKFIGIGFSNDRGDEEMRILYKDNVTLHVPLAQAHLVSRYIGLGNKAPQLNKLGDARWQKARKNAEKAVADYAAQLLRVQAERSSGKGYAHPSDNKWMWEFENSFPYRETPDQLHAIADVKEDMESDKPMDRLICGDVGFGKTEVAIRAAFKAVTGGKQVAVLVPTTVLAEQHFRTFRSRMSEYPVRIEMLSRFSTAGQIRTTLEGLAAGAVDVVIGTHRLVSDDVFIKNIGLVVIDEEQRFGVKHKEVFKEKFRGIDVLTLSATPIPRTLYISLMGARDMSTIETPPVNRLPVQTSVCAYDERIIKSAIRHELERGGQVFFLHNRVKTIELFKDKINSLVPEAKIAIGHGQMAKDELEEVMRSFVHGEVDVLLSTTIIESGIDIPNANTIIIDRADRFGLADLYQLRGRVGRSGHLAYAYLMLPRSSLTTGDARRRVSAIKQYTELGSGFKIAMRDLEIRGAGNLLGTRQSGHIAAIGFDLYCQLLQQSIAQMQGRLVAPRVDVVFKADFIYFREFGLSMTSKREGVNRIGAYIPMDYIDDPRQRISVYKGLANASETRDIDRMLNEWRDRFGRVPEEAGYLAMTHRIKILASRAKISQIEVAGTKLMLTRNGEFILLSGKFPRLSKVKPEAKLHEIYSMMQTL